MKTALYDHHRALNAKLIDFGGWEMPIQYKGIIHEHQTVRSHVGIFDVSHMGRIMVEGLMAEALLDHLSTNQIIGKKDGSATYTVWCHDDGTCVDDLIVYRISETQFFVIGNAGNREKDLEHLLHYSAGQDVIINDRYHEDGILAIQGPNAMELTSKIFPDAANLKPMTFYIDNYEGDPVTISRTGYTGAGGVEICASNATIVLLWETFLTEGKPYGIEPIGLGARDTLRLEMGFALYGHELSDKIAPNESVSGWTINWDKPDFIGKAALEKLEIGEKKRREYGIILTGEGIAREGYPVLQDGKQIGLVTSGNFSPTLNQSIALVLVDKNLQVGDSVEVQIRQHRCPAHVVNLPFIGTVSH